MSPETASNVELFCALLVAAATLGAHAYAFLRLDRYIERKGYRSPFRGAGMMLAYLVTAGAGFAYDASQPGMCWSCSVAQDPEYYRADLLVGHLGSFAWHFVLATTLLLVLVAAVAGCIPVPTRRGGARQPSFPWRAVRWISLAGMPLSLLAGFTSIGWAGASMLLFICSGAHTAGSHFSKRHETPPMDEVLAEDGRPPVLYLRAFDDEGELFAMPRTNECLELGIPLRTPQSFLQSLTCDAFFATAVAGLGPFVALGSPYDYLPPVGASRVYLEDENWREEFHALSRDSACILMAPSGSPNLVWELGSLLASGYQQKVFILTSPAVPGWYRWLTRFGRDQQSRWQAFAAGLAASGIDIGPYPGAGATVGFDAQGVAIVHATASRSPNEYISAIQAALPTPVSGERGGEPGEAGEPPVLAEVGG